MGTISAVQTWIGDEFRVSTGLAAEDWIELYHSLMFKSESVCCLLCTV